MDVGSAAAYYAGSIVLRKTFEAVAQRSLSSIFSSLRARFHGQHQLHALQKELESRLQVLSLPVDMCIQYVLHGNTALQGALDMVTLLINDIISFQEELETQLYNENIPKSSQAEAAKRLEGFLSRLDSILPYLALAVNAVSLLRTTHASLSPSRLMEASFLVRCARSKQGVVMTITAKLHKFETRLTLPRWQEKMLICNASLRRSPDLPEDKSNGFELFITNGESSGDDDEASLCFPIDRISAIGSSTVHVLGLGEHDLEAVLLFDLLSADVESRLESNLDAFPATPLQEASNRSLHYALQCVEDDWERSSDEAKCSDGNSSEDDGSMSNDMYMDSHSVVSTSRISRLGLFEYALRLCMLQSIEEKNHWKISDERIQMFFADPRYMCEPVANVPKAHVNKGIEDHQGKKSPTGRRMHTPTGPSSVASLRSSRQLSITEMFYDLHVDSPATAKHRKDEL